MAHITHSNARLIPAGRLALARCVVEDGWTLRRAAERGTVDVFVRSTLGEHTSASPGCAYTPTASAAASADHMP